MILCDTNIIIETIKQNRDVVPVMRRFKQEELYISPVTIAELYYGAFDKQEMRRLQHHLAPLPTLPINIDISTEFVRLMETYALSHRPTIPDMLIAATAVTHQIPLYTLNLKDFRYITHLELFVP